MNAKSIESAVEQITNEYDEIAEIHIWHEPLLNDLDYPDVVPSIHIRVYTGEAESDEEWRNDLIEADYLTVDIGHEEPLEIPFEVMATFLGPGNIQGDVGTTIYMAENVTGSDSRSVETGLEIFREKLAAQCPTCEESLDETSSLIDHYRSSQSCIKRL